MKDYKPRLVCFSCKFGWGYLKGNDELAASVRNWIPVTCSGKVDATHILNAFKNGADGVLILGCPEGECHFQDGNYQTKKKVLLLKKVLTAFGIEPQRVRMELSIDPEGKTIPALVEKMAGEIKKLGPVKIRNSAVA